MNPQLAVAWLVVAITAGCGKTVFRWGTAPPGDDLFILVPGTDPKAWLDGVEVEAVASGNVTAVADGSRFDGGGIVVEDAAALADTVAATGQFSVEAWVTPADPMAEGPGRIVTMSASISERNFTVGQGSIDVFTEVYAYRVRNTGRNNNGLPQTETNNIATTQQTHLVLTFTPTREVLYVNAVAEAERDNTADNGPLRVWNRNMPVVVGNEATLDRPFIGVVHRVAVLAEALDAAAVADRYREGGQSVSTWVCILLLAAVPEEELPSVAIDGRGLQESHAKKLAFGDLYKRLAVHLVQERFAVVAPEQPADVVVRLSSIRRNIEVSVSTSAGELTETIPVHQEHVRSQLLHRIIAMVREVPRPERTTEEGHDAPPPPLVVGTRTPPAREWQVSLSGGIEVAGDDVSPVIGATTRWSPPLPLTVAVTALVVPSRNLAPPLTSTELGGLLEVAWEVHGESLATDLFAGGGGWGQRFSREERVQWHWQAAATAGIRGAFALGMVQLGVSARILVLSRPAEHREGDTVLHEDMPFRPVMSVFVRFPR